MTKFIKSLAFCIFITVSSFGQTFEGQITYENKYKSKLSNITDEMFGSMMGSVQEYFIKGGNYKSSTNGTFFQWQLYINKDNKLYNKMSNSPVILWNDGAVNTDEVLKAEITNAVVDVLGYSCHELILTCKSGIQKYYFSDKIKIDPKLYEKHKFGNWSEFVSKTNSLPLKISIDNPKFTLECVASAVIPKSMDDTFFVLPADAKIEKSPY